MNSRSDSTGPFGVIVLAASRGAETVKEFGTAHKCTLPIAGRPMLMRVLEALEQSRSAGEVVISIDAPEVLEAEPGLDKLTARTPVHIRRAKASAPESAADALAAFETGTPVLVTTADNVLLTPEAVDAFCSSAADSPCDIAFGVLAEGDVTRRFPGARRTFWRFADGGYKACNLFACLTPRAGEMVALWRHAEKNRKKPWKVAALFGPGLLFSFLLRRKSLAQMLDKVSKRFQVRLKHIVLPFPEIAIDVDRRADITAAEEVLAARRSPRR